MSKLIVANLKSHKTALQMTEWLEVCHQALGASFKVGLNVVVAPPFPLLGTVHQYVTNAQSELGLAVQDISPFPPGSYTGAVAAESVHHFDVTYALVGHSERRRYFHETHQEVANKVEQAVAHGLTPIVCLDDEYIQAQASSINPTFYSRCVVAYEPLEAIGSGQSQPAVEVAPVIAKIKAVFGPVKVIYGGSVQAATVHSYLEVCQGVLVGHAALDPQEFVSLIKAA